MRLFLFLALFIAVIIIVFTAQNQTDITLTFLNWELSKPLPVMLAVPFFVGVIAGIALVVPAWMKKSKNTCTVMFLRTKTVLGDMRARSVPGNVSIEMIY